MQADRREEKDGAERWLFQVARGARSELVSAVAWAFAAGVLIVVQARLLARACHQVVIEGAGVSAVAPLVRSTASRTPRRTATW